jgi:VanZ family protein
VKNRSGYFLFLLILVFPFFFLGGPGYYAARSYKSAWDLGHILFFSLASVELYKYYGSRASHLKPVHVFLRVFLVVFFLGLMIELLQMRTSGRSPDVFDILRNQLGALIGFVFFCSVRKKLSPFVIRTMQAGTILLLLCFLWPLTRAVIDERLTASQFPLLSDFETPFEAHRWQDIHQLQRVGSPVRHGKKSLRVQLSTKKYSGTALFYFSGDWSKYQWLNFSVYNPENIELSLHSRIHDRLHRQHGQVFKDRFHQQFTLHSGWNDLLISLDAVRTAPAGREMNMQEIEGFGIFVIRQPRPFILYLDNVYLSN